MRTESRQSAGGRILAYALAVLVLPAIPFYLLAYRLLGESCSYHWPETDVRPARRLSENQMIFVRIFPALLLVVAFVVLSVLL